MSAIVDWIVGLMAVIGAPGVGVATALETVFPPIPSELVLPLAGFTAQRGEYTVLAAIVWATIGSVVGALVLYQLGRIWGLERLRSTAERIPLLHASDVDKAMDAFAKRGRTSVLVGRLIPGVRSFVSIPAGIDRMPLATFLIYTTIGSAAWNALLVGLGHELGNRWTLVETYVGRFSTVVWTLIGLAVAVFVTRRLRRRSRALAEAESR
ncbi:DedA family protein [Arsenicicoccus piscis]|uniref:Membrane protein n=1 Tax=Arsenicicoccus piscis TaxID=673954 RepID=A0ABQ6HVC5_9MICO|nr:DedA family protein [Arsenicicoccus piscis]MCH8627361.1 DedA family protein [Arsenicicoccus piscis]GMA21510.1 membrane protein [Arsenicicoccus piscis]GMA22171.1 membrane protein [Arsenicicoccus piscis]GMA22219.1 membrane protein [Arsenicicoccus piscis]